MKYVVSMAIDGRIDLEVEANSPEEAYKRSDLVLGSADMNTMNYIKANPVSCEDENGNMTEF